MRILAAFFVWLWLRWTVPLRLAWRRTSEVQLSDGSKLPIWTWTLSEWLKFSPVVREVVTPETAVRIVCGSVPARQRPRIRTLSGEDLGVALRAALALTSEPHVIGPVQALIEAHQELERLTWRGW